MDKQYYYIDEDVEYTIKRDGKYLTNKSKVVDLKIVNDHVYLYKMENGDLVYPSEMFKKIIKRERRKLTI